MTHELPFSYVRNGTEVVIRTQRGEKPRRPEDPRVKERGLDDELWALLQRCWAEKDERPSINEIVEFFDTRST
jgi:hypothetical protein